MAERNYLAFDLGAESGRAVLGRLKDGKLKLAEQHRFQNPTSRMNGHWHWNLPAQWEELKTGLRKTAADVKLDGIGVDTWGVDFGLVTKSGEILGNPYCYRDSRTDGVMEKTFAQLGREKIFQHTGIQFMQINTLFQMMSMVQQKSPLLEIADTFLMIPDLFNFLFTGVRKCEFSNASTTQMLDPRTRTWATDMLKGLGIPTHILPEIVPAGTILGTLTKDVADETGAGALPVIAPGTHDTASAVAAVPAGGGSWCYVSSGSWSLMGVELDAPVINEKSLKYNYTNEGAVGGKIRFLKNIMGMLLVQECRKHWQKQGHDHSYTELTSMAARSEGLRSLVNPNDAAFFSIGDFPTKIEAFCKRTKQPIPGTRGEFVRACLDSLALMYRYTLEGLEDVLGRRIDVIHIVGGGTQNELMSQLAADACGRTVIAGPVEATSIGNILVQAMAGGDVKSLDEVRAIVRASFVVKKYEPTDGTKWETAYKRFRELIEK